jgi:hypothetical protein
MPSARGSRSDPGLEAGTGGAGQDGRYPGRPVRRKQRCVKREDIG